jgi:hypothetical protein
MLGYWPVSWGRRVDILEFNSCRHDCELSGGFGAMVIATVFHAAMRQKALNERHCTRKVATQEHDSRGLF